MSITKYETFVRVVELGSITRAAEELGYTQSGVSHIINALESETGLTLLTRSRSGIRLTDDGARLLPNMRTILAGAEQLRQTVASIKGLAVGTVRVGAFTSVAVHWLPGIIKTFLREYPDIEFKLFNGDYHDVETWLSDGTIDVGFVTLPSCENFTVYPLREDRLLALVPKDHRLKDASCFPLEALREEPFISLLQTSSHDVRRVLEAHGITPNIRFTTKDDYAIIAMVEQGLGVSILPELVLQGRCGGVVTMELETMSRRMVGMAVVPSPSQATRRFVECAKRWIAEQ